MPKLGIQLQSTSESQSFPALEALPVQVRVAKPRSTAIAPREIHLGNSELQRADSQARTPPTIKMTTIQTSIIGTTPWLETPPTPRPPPRRTTAGGPIRCGSGRDKIGPPAAPHRHKKRR